MKLKRLNGFSRNGFMKFIVLSLTLTLLLVVSGANSAEPVVVWERTYGGNANDWANSIIETSDGYVVAGHTESKGAGGADAWIIKLDRNGNIVWDRTYGGSDWDWADSVIETSDGYYVVVGYTASKGAGSGDAWVIKLDRDGNIVWDKTYGGDLKDGAESIIETSDGYVVAGHTYSKGAGGADAWVIKLDRNGNVVWDKTYGGDYNDEAYSIIETSDGYYVVAGHTESKGAGSHDVWVIKLDRNGNVVWDRTYGGSDWDWADSVIETSDGYYVVVGYTASKGAGSGDAWVIKLDRDGNIVWDKTYGGSDWDRSFSITSSSNGCCIVVGDTKSKRDTFDIWVLKINYTSSQLNWDKTIGWDRSDEVGYSVVRTSDGYYVIAGWTKPKEKDEVDAQVIKLKDQTPESIHPIELYTNDSTTNKSSNLEYTLKDQNQKPIKTTTETVNANQLIVLISVLVISFISIAAARSKRRKDLDKVKKYKHALDENVADTLKIGSAPPVPTPFPDFPQELLTKYQPLKYLGEGGFARVFKCKRLNDGKIVAVKIPKVSNDFVRRSFLKEVAAWFNLNHPNIVKLYDADYKPVEHIEVEFIEGVEVNGKIVRDLDEYPKPVDESTAIKLIKGIAEGLSHAHSRGIIHRDLKPLNILLTPSLIPKITDWGLAKLASSSTTTPALSPLYAAPEQIDSAKYGKPDHRTDIYQLGLIFYELLTGKSPYEGYTPAAIAGKILSEEIKPPLPSKFNPELVKYDGIIERMLAKRKEDRYQSVEEFLKQLESIGKLQAELEELKKTLSETKQSLRRSRSKEEIERLTKEAVEKTAKIAILSAKLNDKVGLISALEDMKLYTKENLDELLNAISQIELMMNEGIPISDDFVNMIEVLLHRIVRENR